MTAFEHTTEGRRLATSASEDSAWRKWGPYVSARQWGTVREDYSADGDAWTSFPFEQAHRRAYRWGEDGLAGLCDRYGFLNLSVALWNHHDDRLKERPFGLTNPQGNHGEDVKEYYWALDAVPTHAWAQWLYRYPQAAFPYQDLVTTNAARGTDEDEYELADTGVLNDNRFFDVTVTHAKAHPTDICMVIEATNHGPDAAPLDVIAQLWFRNTWSWGEDHRRPKLTLDEPDPAQPGDAGVVTLIAEHGWLGRYRLAAEGAPEVGFCENETNAATLFGVANTTPYPKDAIDTWVVHNDPSALNPAHTGTKAALRYRFDSVAAGATVRVQLRLSADEHEEPLDSGAPGSVRVGEHPFATFDEVISARRAEADEFYAAVIPSDTPAADVHIARRAFAGLLWGKQLYRYDVRRWLTGDPDDTPPPERLTGRNADWHHLNLADVMSMPDDWEYPWFAAWDLAFHCVALAHIDPAFAKNQLLLLCREWAQHPDGQLPAYEWAFGDVNPPVHAWAAWQVYLADGARDQEYLVRIVTKLLLNFGWWVNRKDVAGNNLFEGGFLGMDNISLFDRSAPMPPGWRLEQSDATSWVAFYCLSLMRMSLDLARTLPAFEDISVTFLERFLGICRAMESVGTDQVSLWDEQDGFFYDALVNEDGEVAPVRVRSLVGFVPLLAVGTITGNELRRFTDMSKRLRWLRQRRPDLSRYLLTEQAKHSDSGGRLTVSLVGHQRMPLLLKRLFDTAEFWSDHGVRSLSASYRDGAEIHVVDRDLPIKYVPGTSDSRLFGGNSNWRGPVWFPLNVLIVDALRAHDYGVDGGHDWEFPTGSGQMHKLGDAADDLADRLIDLFRPGADGRSPSTPRDHPSGPLWDVHPTFSEYFDGDNGAGLGASHQTGWTALVAHLICGLPPQLGQEVRAEQGH